MNIKRMLLSTVAALSLTAAVAVPAKPGLRTFSQPDGTKIELNLIGDEYFHSYVTSDGLAVARQQDGFFYYVEGSKLTGVRASSPEMRSAAEKAFISGNVGKLSLSARIKEMKPALKARKQAGAPKKATQVPNNGSPRVPVLLVQYKDVKFKDADPKATFEKFFKNGSESARQYFVDQSNGKYTPEFDVYGPVTLSGNRSVYGGNDYWGNDEGVGTMVGEGCLGLKDEIDFSRYDNNGDGECDVVIVLYAGDGEASSDDKDAENAVWPCQWDLASSDYKSALYLNDVTVNKFAVFNELFGGDLTQIDGIGTFCHEFSHCLGLPDFYDTNYNGHFGMANWSLLDSGCYNNDGFTPCGYTAYEKAFMNWIELEEATEDTYYTLDPFNQNKDRALKITNSKDEDEYYIIENRRRKGWDEYMVAEGLLITHVTYDDNAWAQNCVNDYDLQRMTLIPADNELKMTKHNYFGETYYVVDEESLKGDLWPFGPATELTDVSTPAAKVNTGGYMSKPVTAITDNGDGTVSFWFMKAPLPAVETPVVGNHNIDHSKGFTATWEAGDANDVTYTLEVKEYKEIPYTLLESVDFSAETSWQTSGYAEGEDDGTRLGSSKQQGSVTSGKYDAGEEETVTVVVNSKYYGTDNSEMKVSLLNASGTAMESKTFDLKDYYSDYTALFAKKFSGEFKVKIETTAKKQRVYLKRVDIYAGDATEREPMRVSASETGNETYRLITGITGNSYSVAGLKENGEFEYRVKAVPNDTETLSESAWSEKKRVCLDTSTGVSIVVDSDSEAEYFNLQGMRVESKMLQPGIYLCRKNGKTIKVLVK